MDRRVREREYLTQRVLQLSLQAPGTRSEIVATNQRECRTGGMDPHSVIVLSFLSRIAPA
jgi:hypothetical protein